MNYDQIGRKQVDAQLSTSAPTALDVSDTDNQSCGPSPEPVPSAADIPLLNDIVAEPAVYRPILARSDHSEFSADDELARTNKYKTLSERDLERAEAANDTHPAALPASDGKVKRLMLDECLIDDDLEINFDDDSGFEDSLYQLEQELDSQATIKPHHKAILPDLDKLNSELGVDPLPREPSLAKGTHFQTTAAPLADTGAVGDSRPKGSPANLATSSSMSQPEVPVRMPAFTVAASAFFSAGDNPFCFTSPTVSGAADHAFTEADLETAVEEALREALPAIKLTVLQKLAPLLPKDSPQKE